MEKIKKSEELALPSAVSGVQEMVLQALKDNRHEAEPPVVSRKGAEIRGEKDCTSYKKRSKSRCDRDFRRSEKTDQPLATL